MGSGLELVVERRIRWWGEVGVCDWVWLFALWVNVIESLFFLSQNLNWIRDRPQACGWHSQWLLINIIILCGHLLAINVDAYILLSVSVHNQCGLLSTNPTI